MVRFIVGCLILGPWLALAGGLNADDKRAEPPLLMIVRDGKCGFIDRTGKVVVPPRFSFADNFADGMARVAIDKQCTYINQAGELLAVRFDPPCRFQDRQYTFAEGLAVFRIGGKEKRMPDGYRTEMVGGRYGYIDRSGAKVIDAQFAGAGSFAEGLAAVKTQTQWGYIDKRGKLVIPPRFDDATEFHGGLARVAVGGKWGFIDKQGATIVPPSFDALDDFHEDRARVQLNSLYGFIDRKGQLVIPAKYEYASPFSCGRAMTRVDTPQQKFGYLDKAGQFVIPAKYGDARDFSEGLAPVKVAGLFASEGKPEALWGYIDPSGTYVIRPKFSYAETFSEGLAPAAVDRPAHFGYIERRGELVIRPQFDYRAGPFRGGIAQVFSDRDYETRDEFGYIDTTGRFIWKVRALEVKRQPAASK